MARGDWCRRQAEKPEGGYGWVVVAASFVTHAITGGVLYSMGIFYIMFKENLEGESSVIALVPSIFSSCSFALAPLSGVLTDRYDGRLICTLGSTIAVLGFMAASMSTQVWHLCLAFGVAGCGQSLAFNPAMSLMAHYFDKRLGMASGISVSGVGAGSLLYPHLLQYLEKNYGWRGAIQLNAAIYLNMFVCAALYRRPDVPPDSGTLKRRDMDEGKGDLIDDVTTVVIIKREKGEANILDEEKGPLTVSEEMEPTEVKSWSTLSKCGAIFRTTTFLWFGFSQLVFMMGSSIVYTHLGAYVISLGYTRHDAAMTYLTIGVSSILSRLAAGFISQMSGCYPLRMYTACVLLLGALTATFPLLPTMAVLLTYSSLFGILSAPFSTFNVIVLSEVMELSLLPTAIGFLLLCLGPGALLGPPIAGMLSDSTGMYGASFFFASALMALSGVIIMPVVRCRRQGDNKATTKVVCNTATTLNHVDQFR